MAARSQLKSKPADAPASRSARPARGPTSLDERAGKRPPVFWTVALLLVLSAVLVACIVVPDAISQADDSNKDAAVQQVTIADKTFKLELALTPMARYRGLSNRASVAADGGMLFVFRYPEVQQFVMRECLVPIDIAFLDAKGKVVATHAMQVEPYDTPEGELKRYSSGKPAVMAVELQGGMLDKLGIKPGDTIELPYQDLKRRTY